MPPSNFGARPSIATAWHSRGSPTGCGAGAEHGLQHRPRVVGRAANQKIARRIAPRLAQPVEVRLEAAGREHDCTCLELVSHAARSHRRGAKAAIVEREADDFRVIAHLDAEPLGGGVVGIHQRRAAAQEKGVGARQVQRAAQRRLKARADRRHPRHAIGRARRDERRERFIGLALVDAPQILEQLLLGVGLGEDRRSAQRARSADCACVGCCRRAGGAARTRARRRARRGGVP